MPKAKLLKSQYGALREALEFYYGKSLGLSGAQNNEGFFTDKNGFYRFPDLQAYREELSDATEIPLDQIGPANIRGVERAIISGEASAQGETEMHKEEEQLAGNMPKDLKGKIDHLNFSEEERKELYKRNIEEVENFVAQKEKLTEQTNFIEQQRLKTEDLQKALEGKKVYIKIEKVENLQNSGLKEQSQISARKFIETTTEIYKTKLANQNLSQPEIDNIAEQAALTTYETLNGNSPLQRMAILKKLSSQDNLNKITSDPEMQSILRTAVKARSNSLASQYEIYRQFIDVEKTGEVNVPGKVQVDVSFDPADLQKGYEEFDPNQEITTPHLEMLSDQGNILGNLRIPMDIGIREIKSRLLRSTGDALAKRIKALPADSRLAETFNSRLVQFGLSQMGLVAPAEWVAVEGSWVGNLIVSTGYGPIAGVLQGITGFDLGVVQVIPIAEAGELAADTFLGTEAAMAIGGDVAAAAVPGGAGVVAGAIGKAATTAGAEAVVEGTAAVAGGEIATATGLGAAIGNIPGLIIGAVIGLIVSALPAIGKFIDKHKGEFLGGGIMMILAGSTLGSLAIIAVGAPIALLGGAAIVGAGEGIGGVFAVMGGLFSAIFGGIMAIVGPPILATFITLAVAVPLILFIINSGAYVVPPGGFGESSGIPISGTPVNLQCDSLDKSLDPAAYAAELIACALDKLGLNPLSGSMVGGNKWQQLTTVLNKPATDALSTSAVGETWLQCIGYVSATAGQANGNSFGSVNNACAYTDPGNHPTGYKYVSGTNGMGAGDFFVIGSKTCSKCGTVNAPVGSCGHIGVVISVTGVGVNCADANEIGNGKVRVANGCFVLSNITGYLKKN